MFPSSIAGVLVPVPSGPATLLPGIFTSMRQYVSILRRSRPSVINRRENDSPARVAAPAYLVARRSAVVLIDNGPPRLSSARATQVHHRCAARVVTGRTTLTAP